MGFARTVGNLTIFFLKVKFPGVMIAVGIDSYIMFSYGSFKFAGQTLNKRHFWSKIGDTAPLIIDENRSSEIQSINDID